VFFYCAWETGFRLISYYTIQRLNEHPRGIEVKKRRLFRVAQEAASISESSNTNSSEQEISSFQQNYDESLSQAWEWFKGLLNKNRMHGFDDTNQINIFLGRLRAQTKLILDVSARGMIKSKKPMKLMRW